MNKEQNLTPEQKEKVDEIMKRESWQTKVDKIVAQVQTETEEKTE